MKLFNHYLFHQKKNDSVSNPIAAVIEENSWNIAWIVALLVSIVQCLMPQKSGHSTKRLLRKVNLAAPLLTPATYDYPINTDCITYSQQQQKECFFEQFFFHGVYCSEAWMSTMPLSEPGKWFLPWKTKNTPTDLENVCSVYAFHLK